MVITGLLIAMLAACGGDDDDGGARDGATADGAGSDGASADGARTDGARIDGAPAIDGTWVDAGPTSCGAETCSADQVCVELAGGALLQQCEADPCAPGRLEPGCACESRGCVGGCSLSGRTIYCNTCPPGPPCP